MKRKRASFWRLISISLSILFISGMKPSTTAAQDQKFPTKPITILCGSAPGSPVDVMARTVAKLAEKRLGQPIVVETKKGGSGAVALAYLMDQPADGYTLFAMTRSQSIILPVIIKKFTYKDFEYIIRIEFDPYVLAVRADSRFKTIKALVDFSKENPRKVKVGGLGSLTFHHVATLGLARAAGIELGWVPFDGGTEALMAVLGGHIDAAATTPVSTTQHVMAGTVRLLGIATEKGLQMGTQNIPSFKESGINFVDYIWRGIITKKGVSPGILAKLHNALRAAITDPEYKAYMEKYNLMPGYLPPEEFTAFVAKEVVNNVDLLKSSKLLK